jgi:alpha-tubulin suppressor-like RCC1 family protein
MKRAKNGSAKVYESSVLLAATALVLFVTVSGRAAAGQSCTLTQVSAGWYHSCGIQPDGTAQCWGRNDYGQASPPSGGFTAVSVGDSHACGIRSDGSVQCWGANDYSQSSPPSGTFTQISAGGY